MEIYLDTSDINKPISEKDFGKIPHIATKYVKGTTYKYVYQRVIKNEKIVYEAYISTFKWSKYFLDEREAAIAVDKKLLENNRNPVNILIPKK